MFEPRTTTQEMATVQLPARRMEEREGFLYFQDKSLTELHCDVGRTMGQIERFNGPCDQEMTTYRHSTRTALNAMKFGFSDEVVVACLLHDYVDRQHIGDGEAGLEDRYEHIRSKVTESYLGEEGADEVDGEDVLEARYDFIRRQVADSYLGEEGADEVVGILRSKAQLEQEAAAHARAHMNQLGTVAELFQQHRPDINFIQSIIEDRHRFGANIVLACESLDNLAYPLPSEGRPVDLLEGYHDIFSTHPHPRGMAEGETLTSVSELAEDSMVRDAFRLLNYYLPIFEASGVGEAVTRIKDRTMQLLAPNLFDKARSLIAEREENGLNVAEAVYKHLHEQFTKKGIYADTDSSKPPSTKGVGSSIIKFLRYAGRNHEMAQALSRANGDDEILQAMRTVFDQMRDLMRARYVIPHMTEGQSNHLSSFKKAIEEVIRHAHHPNYSVISFSEDDIATGQAVEIFVNSPSFLNGLNDRSDVNISSRGSEVEGANICVTLDAEGKRVPLEIQILTSSMLNGYLYGETAAHSNYKLGLPGSAALQATKQMQQFLYTD